MILTGLACLAIPRSSASSSSRAAAATVSACSSDAAWAAEGQDLRSFELEHPTTLQKPGSKLVTMTPFAYESLPVNVTGPGTYAFDFGPLLDGFHWGSNPNGAGFLWPPDFAGGASPVAAPSPPHVIWRGYQRYFQQEIQISGPACTGLRLWMF